jgi:hypothetical protein
MSLLDEALSAAAEEAVPSIDVDVELAGKHLPLRFYRIDGEKWAELTAMSPVRLSSPIDRKYGYNFQAVARLAAPLSGRVLDGGEELQYDDDKWDALFKRLSGHAIRLIHSNIWDVNEYAPQLRIAEAKKDSAASSAPKRS